MSENECKFCEKTPSYYLEIDGLRAGFCENCKNYTINKIANIIRREG
jgi:hypothetical protein